MMPAYDDLAAFLRSAKAATYASQGDAASVPSLLPGAKQLEYRSGAYFYRDIYVGMLRFVGQEIVYRDDIAIWSMSYSGGLTHGVAAAAAKTVYTVLRQALRDAPTDLPLRGPASFASEGLRYTCRCEGTLEWFQGSESIESDRAALYSLNFSGGRLG